jgi:hypothetical protein
MKDLVEQDSPQLLRVAFQISIQDDPPGREKRGGVDGGASAAHQLTAGNSQTGREPYLDREPL